MNDPARGARAGSWEVGYDGHEVAQRRRLAATTFRQKLEWLEEAHRLVLHLERSRERTLARLAAGEPDTDPRSSGISYRS